jgi:hypothetical protein
MQHSHYPGERLMAALDGARLVRYDADGYLLAWFGGHGVHVYDAAGEEVHYWSCGDFSHNDADVADVEASIAAYLRGEHEDERPVLSEAKAERKR